MTRDNEPLEHRDNYYWKKHCMLKAAMGIKTTTGWTNRGLINHRSSPLKTLNSGDHDNTAKELIRSNFKRKYQDISSSPSSLCSSFVTSDENGYKKPRTMPFNDLESRTSIEMPTKQRTEKQIRNKKTRINNCPTHNSNVQAKNKTYRRKVNNGRNHTLPESKPMFRKPHDDCCMSFIPVPKTIYDLKELVAKYYKEEEKADTSFAGRDKHDY